MTSAVAKSRGKSRSLSLVSASAGCARCAMLDARRAALPPPRALTDEEASLVAAPGQVWGPLTRAEVRIIASLSHEQRRELIRLAGRVLEIEWQCRDFGIGGLNPGLKIG
jgi:hypothetical protein